MEDLIQKELQPFNVIMEEKIKMDHIEEELKKFINIHKSNLKNYLNPWDQKNRDFISTMYHDHIQRHRLIIKNQNKEEDMKKCIPSEKKEIMPKKEEYLNGLDLPSIFC